MINDGFEHIAHGKLILILIIVSYFLLMFGNGIVSLTHPDEVFYVQSAKEMLAYDNWLTPMIFDQPHFEKPIFFFWLLAFNIKLFGVTPFVARFWPAFFGILGVGVTYWIAWMLFERKRLAFLSGLILSSSFIYLTLSRAVLTDMVFSIWVVISIGFFYWAYHYKQHKKLGIILGFIFSAIAVLTKGIFGFTFPIGVILIYLMFRKDLGFLKDRAVFIGLFLFILMALPWHLWVYQRYGSWFVDEYFLNVHVRRLFYAEHPKLDHWAFYPVLMFAGILPWSLYWVPAGLSIFRDFRKRTQLSDPMVFLLSWILGIYVFVQPAHSKLASYIFPIFPAIAIILGQYLHEALDSFHEQGKARALKTVGYLTAVIATGGALVAIVYAQNYLDIVENITPVYVFSSLMILTALVIFVFIQSQQYVKMLIAHTGITMTVLAMLFFARPYAEPWVSCKDISDVFKTIDNSKTPVLASKFYARGIRFYTDRPMAVIDINGKGFFSPHPIPFLNTDPQVLEFLNNRPVTYAIVKEGNVKDLERILHGQPYQMEQLQGMGGKYILRITKI